MVLSFFHRFIYIFKLKELCAAQLPLWKWLWIHFKQCCTPLCKGTVQNDATLCKEWCDFMHARNAILLDKEIAAQGCTRHVLGDFDLKTNFKGNAETGWLILSSSLGCVVFPPMVSSSISGRVPKPWEHQQKHAHMGDIHEMWLSSHGPTTHGPLLVCFSHFLQFWQKLQKLRENQQKTNTIKQVDGGPWVAGT